MGRAAEAHTWFDKAVKLAPSRRDLRLALISQLAQDQKFAEAASEYQALDQAEPNNPDTLRDWGALVLRDTTKTQAEQKAAAAAIWRKMLDAKPNDAVTTAQVADLLRQAELTEQALELYRKAATLRPPTLSITNTSANTSITSNGPTRPRPPGPRSPRSPTATPRPWPGSPRSSPDSDT